MISTLCDCTVNTYTQETSAVWNGKGEVTLIL
jgi:hypothetical protein